MKELIRKRIEKADNARQECVYTLMEVFDVLLNIKELQGYRISVVRNTFGEVIFSIGESVMLPVDEADP